MQPALAERGAALESFASGLAVNRRRRDGWLRSIHYWTRAVLDLRTAFEGLSAYAWFLNDWRKYAAMRGAGKLRLLDAMPQLHDRRPTTPIDSHYFFLNAWAMRRIAALGPRIHVDIGSAVQFASLLSAVVPTCFLDYRPLPARCSGMAPAAADILALPFRNGSLPSVSCLHVAEHIGLGRYGDPLDPEGARKAARELIRVLAPGGSLFFGVPVGRERTCFNAHRIFCPATVCSYFESLELMEFSGVRDAGRFDECALLEDFNDESYACGMYWFRKPEEGA